MMGIRHFAAQGYIMSQFVSAIAVDDVDGLAIHFSLGLYASNSLVLRRDMVGEMSQPPDERGIVVQSDDDDPNERLHSVSWSRTRIVLLSSHKEYVLDVAHVSSSDWQVAYAQLQAMNADGVVALELVP